MTETGASASPSPAGAVAGDIEALSQQVLVDLIGISWYGFAVLDARRRYVYVNPAGCRLLGSTSTELIGSVAPFPPVDEVRPGQTVTFTIDVEAAQAGDARFRAEVKAAHLATPLKEEQATRVLAK